MHLYRRAFDSNDVWERTWPLAVELIIHTVAILSGGIRTDWMPPAYVSSSSMILCVRATIHCVTSGSLFGRVTNQGSSLVCPVDYYRQIDLRSHVKVT